MGLINFQVVFDQPLATYYCGQAVSGRLMFSLSSPKKLRGVVVKITGEAGVRWTKQERRTDSNGEWETRTVTYYDNEIYFKNEFYVNGGPSGDFTLEVGEYSYPFSAVLPTNIPSSFEHNLGYIRYTVKGKIDRPWRFDHETKAAFSVISPLDLNTHPTAKDPVKVVEEKYFGCCCCKSGPLTVVLCLPVGGYVPGQQMPVTVEVDNASEQDVSRVSLSLRKIMDFYAKYPSRDVKHEHVKIVEAQMEGVEQGKSKTFIHQFSIPALPPSKPGACRCIEMKYEVKIEVLITSCCHRNVVVKAPFLIGTIPLASYQRPIPPSDFGTTSPSLWPTMPAAPQPQGSNEIGFKFDPPPGYPDNQPLMHNPVYPDLPPPSYPEAMYGGHNIHDPEDGKHMQGNVNFTPRYPMYNFEPSAPPL